MKILSLDFSTSQRSVAVVQPLTGTEPRFQSEIVAAGGRSTRAFGMIERALTETRLERDDIECIALGLGPGSYTGIRASIALAQGWQLAHKVKLLGIDTAEVLAAQAQIDGVRGLVHIVVDAQRGEFYCATWRLSNAGWTETSPLCIVDRQELQSRIATGNPVMGPDLERTLPDVGSLFPSARVLGHLALGRTNFVPGEQLVPVYLRETSFVRAAAPRKRM